MSDELSEGWTDTLLTDICARDKFAIVDGPFGSDLKLTDYVPDGTVPVLTTKNLTGTYDPNTVRFISPEKFEQLKRSKVVGGDILIAKIGSIGKCSLYPVDAPTAIIPANLCKISADDRIVFNRYLCWQIKAEGFQSKLWGITSATAQPAFSVQRLKTLSVRLAPILEQHRIVAKLENLIDKVNLCQKRLESIPAILKRFRQAILAAACSGKLTEDWRQQNPTLTLDAAEVVSGITPGVSSVCVASDEDPMETFEIPSEWVWARCEHLCDSERAITYGVIKLGAPVEHGIPTLRSSDVRWLRIDEEDVKCISKEIASDYERTFLAGGEILVTVRGTLGGVAVVPSRLAGFNISREVAVLPIHNSLVADFVCYAIAANWSQKWLMQVSKGVAYMGVNIRDLKRIPIPVPPMAEQKEVVRRVRTLLVLADEIEQRVTAAMQRVDRLTQSVLSKAFRGELVPTEAELAQREGREYEPASVLLERIRKERESHASSKSERKRTRTKSKLATAKG
jgi:type I restriction enzyme S subunit